MRKFRVASLRIGNFVPIYKKVLSGESRRTTIISKDIFSYGHYICVSGDGDLIQ